MNDRFRFDKDTAVVETTGGKVRGYAYRGMNIFKGIPYAKARRFHRPEPVSWEGVRVSAVYGPVCPMTDEWVPGDDLLTPHRYWPKDENCQNLNIWTPGLDDEKRPVLVWIHGGGHEFGSSIEHIAYDGENMCFFGQAVVVSLNHRLNILGYFDVSDFGPEYENSANAGTDDLIAALRWIRDNIASFGGDPENVTLLGQSGGGMKITELLQTPEADGLFHKAVNMSGVFPKEVADGLMPEGKESGRKIVEAVLRKMRLRNVSELETAPYEAFAAAWKAVSPALEKKGFYVGGHGPKKNAFYLGDPLEVGFRKETSQIPMVVGSTLGEFVSGIPGEADMKKMPLKAQRALLTSIYGTEALAFEAAFREAYPERKIGELLTTDFVCRAGVLQYVSMRGAMNDCTYSYLFCQDTPIYGGRAPAHCADIPYLFHNTCLVPSSQIPRVTPGLEKEIFDSLMVFARSGNPGTYDLPAWHPVKPGAISTMLFSAHTREALNHDLALIPQIARAFTPALQRLFFGK